jgi:hypothetical protein
MGWEGIKVRTTMKTANHIIKRWDVIITFMFIFLSFVPWAIFNHQLAGKAQANSDSNKYIAVISVNAEEVERVTLTGHAGTEHLDIPEIDCDLNTVEVKKEEIRIKSSDCPEQICINTGYISIPGPAIICLPHRVVIEIQTVEGETDDLIISS